jgi:hypothetical protein
VTLAQLLARLDQTIAKAFEELVETADGDRNVGGQDHGLLACSAISGKKELRT